MGICSSKKTSKQAQSPLEDQFTSKPQDVLNGQTEKTCSLQIAATKGPQNMCTTPTPKKETKALVRQKNAPEAQFSKKYTFLPAALSAYIQDKNCHEEMSKTSKLLMQNNKNGQVVRIETFNSNNNPQFRQYKWLKELQLTNFHLAKIVDIFYQPQLVVIHEYCPYGNLKHLLKQERLNAAILQKILVQMLVAVEYLHASELALEKINLHSFEVLDNEYKIKLTDLYSIVEVTSQDQITSNIKQLGQTFLQLLVNEEIKEIEGLKPVRLRQMIEQKHVGDSQIRRMGQFALHLADPTGQGLTYYLKSDFVNEIRHLQIEEILTQLVTTQHLRKLSVFHFSVIQCVIRRFYSDRLEYYQQLFATLFPLQKVAAQQFKEFYWKKMDSRCDAQLVDAIFHFIDYKNDAAIDYEEYLVAVLEKDVLSSKDIMESTFTRLANPKLKAITLKSLQKNIEFDERQMAEFFEARNQERLCLQDFCKIMGEIIQSNCKDE